jgi:flagellar protein FliO/FliZ
MRRLLTAALGGWAGLTGAAETPGPRPGAVIGLEGVAGTFLGLGLVLALIFAAAWLLRRLGTGSLGGQSSVRILGSALVGSRERVVLVEVEGTRLVLGVAPGRVQTLHVLPAAESFGQTLDQVRERSP